MSNLHISKLLENVTKETQPDQFGDERFCVSRDDIAHQLKNSNYSNETVEMVTKLHSLLDLRIPKDFDFAIYIDNGKFEIELVHCHQGSGEEVDFPVTYDDNMNSTLALVNWEPLRVVQ